MNGVTQRELPFLLLLWGLSDPRIAELRKMPQSFSLKLHRENSSLRPSGHVWGCIPWHAQNPLSGERRKTLSITHHALSPPPSHHHLYIILLINWLQRFYRITMSLKRPFVPKSDLLLLLVIQTTSVSKRLLCRQHPFTERLLPRRHPWSTNACCVDDTHSPNTCYTDNRLLARKHLLSEYCFSSQSWKYLDRMKPEAGATPYFNLKWLFQDFL